ncbi:kynurenine formamidase [Musca vetustissima]|uniref:kynurenine formamidase n=1 Tax=Musca vetustissima TaxID=27455 RepID=UPI002AB70807|nr:kynurenine formamidase [Musca vetustissima]
MVDNEIDGDLEREYSPSLHTKRFQDCDKPNEEVLKNFVNVSREATSLARRLYKTRLDIRYGGKNDNQLLDIYYKEQEHDTPILVFIHGGYWQELDKSTAGPIVHTFVEHNYRVLLVDYDLCPNVTLEQLTQQITNFYKWLKIYAHNTGATKISICGHSAGAHLALQLFDDEFSKLQFSLDFIDHVFLISGLYDLRQLWLLNCTNSNNLLGLDDNSATKLSPICCEYNDELIDKYRQQNIHLHLIVAENDSSIFKTQSQNYAHKLMQLNMNVNYRVFKCYDHFDIIEECSNSSSDISRYMKNEMKI